MTKRAEKFTRRRALKLAKATTIGLAAGELFKPWIVRTAFAQDKQPIKIGFPVPLSGVYGGYAKDQVNGAELAVNQFNANGGVLGRPVQLLVRDDQLDVQINTQLCKELIENDHVDLLSGALGENTILSMNEASREYKKIFIGINQSEDIMAGKNYNKYTFLEAMTPYLSVFYLAKYAIETFKPKRVFTIGPDYKWGLNNRIQWKRRMQDAGVQIVGEIIYPFKSEDYQAFMQTILDAKPDILAASNFGDEQVLFLKQAVAYGLQKKMTIILTLTGNTPRIPAGGPAFENVYGGTSFYWELAKTIPSAGAYVDAYIKAYNVCPSDYGATAYSAIRNMLNAVQAVGSIDNEAIIKHLEGLTYDNYKGKEWYRPCSHQAFQDFYILKSRPQLEGKYGYFEVINTQPWNEGDERSCEELQQG